MSAWGSLLSKLFQVDVDAMDGGHGLGCPCPKHMAERQARMQEIAVNGFQPGTVGAMLEQELSAATGRQVLRKIADAPPLPCSHPQHDPPSAIVLEPGVYEYVCPGCDQKKTIVIRELGR